MGKSLFIAEKPSVAQEFAKALKINIKKYDGYLEGDTAVVTWCVGHLVTMSYPEKYDVRYKKWSLETLPFLPESFLYEVIPNVAKQFQIVSNLLNRPDVDTIYVCTDSGREGEYIYRLVEQMANVQGKQRKRVWIDSQTEEEINRGIREAKDLSEYDNLSNAAYLRAKEDYLMGINFSRLLSLKYGNAVANYLNEKYVFATQEVEEKCKYALQKEQEAFSVERASLKLKQIESILPLVGKTVDGCIINMYEWCMYITLTEQHCDGVVLLADIKNDIFTYNKEKIELIGKYSGTSYKLGEKVQVKIKNCDIEKRLIELSLT